MKRNEDSFRVFWDIKCTNTHITGVPKEEEERERPEKISEEIIAKNILNMGKETLAQIQEVQRVPYRINPSRNTSRQILIKLTKLKTKKKY